MRSLWLDSVMACLPAWMLPAVPSTWRQKNKPAIVDATIQQPRPMSQQQLHDAAGLYQSWHLPTASNHHKVVCHTLRMPRTKYIIMYFVRSMHRVWYTTLWWLLAVGKCHDWYKPAASCSCCSDICCIVASTLVFASMVNFNWLTT